MQITQKFFFFYLNSLKCNFFVSTTQITLNTKQGSFFYENKHDVCIS